MSEPGSGWGCNSSGSGSIQGMVEINKDIRMMGSFLIVGGESYKCGKRKLEGTWRFLAAVRGIDLKPFSIYR